VLVSNSGAKRQLIFRTQVSRRWCAFNRLLKTPGSTRFRDNEVRLKLHALAYTLATFLRCIELPEAAVTGRWCLPSSPQPDDCERRRHVRNRDPNSI